jgi:hypothetical protein
MCNPVERYNIIQQIYNGELLTDTITGQNQKWWLTKHHPDNDISKNIYLLGGGTINELYDKYIVKHEKKLEWGDFINYTRELIKQTIMV